MQTVMIFLAIGAGVASMVLSVPSLRRRTSAGVTVCGNDRGRVIRFAGVGLWWRRPSRSCECAHTIGVGGRCHSIAGLNARVRADRYTTSPGRLTVRRRDRSEERSLLREI